MPIDFTNKESFRLLDGYHNWNYHQDKLYRANLCGYEYITEAVYHLYNMLGSLSNVAYALDVSPTFVSRHLKRMGAELKSSGGYNRSKMLPSKEEVFAEVDKGKTSKEIAEILDVSVPTVNKYRRMRGEIRRVRRTTENTIYNRYCFKPKGETHEHTNIHK